MAGTGFLVRSGASLYFATAGHCLRKGDHNRLRIPETYRTSGVLNLKQFGNTVLPEREIDTDHADFALFSVEPIDFGPRHPHNLEPVYLPHSDTNTALHESILLTVLGYPKAAPLSGIDYDRRVVTVQALVCDANYLGSAESRHCHALRFISSCSVDDFDHLSGSPIFAKLPHRGDVIYMLVGLLLRAGGTQRLGRFVSIEVIKEGIRRFEATATKS